MPIHTYVCKPPTHTHTHNERAAGKMSLEPHLIKALELYKISKDYYKTWCYGYNDESLFYNKYLFYNNSKCFYKTRICFKKNMCLCV